jgi:hypothetical protein
MHHDSAWVFQTSKPKETHKLTGSRQPPHSPSPTFPNHGCAQKQSLDRRSGMSLRTEIKIKTKIPNKTKLAHIYTQTACQPPREGKRARDRQREREVSFPSQLLRELQTESNSQAPNLKQTHLPLSCSDRSPSDARIRNESEKGFSTSWLFLSRRIDRVG